MAFVRPRRRALTLGLLGVLLALPLYGWSQAYYAWPLAWGLDQLEAPLRQPIMVHPFEQRPGTLPLAFWHRGDIRAGQENSEAAVRAALDSPTPHLEVDVIDYVTTGGTRVGLLAHEPNMARTTGRSGRFADLPSLNGVANQADLSLPPDPFLTVVELLDLVQAFVVETGRRPLLSFDLKEDGDEAVAFGRWLGAQVLARGLEEHTVASSAFGEVLRGYREGCSPCLVGGVVYQRHWALQFLAPTASLLDTTPLSRALFFAGFPFREPVPLDFVYIQDDLIVRHPQLLRHWREARGVTYVAAFSSDPTRPYTDDEWDALRVVDWIDLDPPQMQAYLSLRQGVE